MAAVPKHRDRPHVRPRRDGAGGIDREVELAGFGLQAAASVWVWQVRIRQGRTDTDPSWIEAGSLAKRLRPEDVCPINSSHGDTAVRIEHPAEEVK